MIKSMIAAALMSGLVAGVALAQAMPPAKDAAPTAQTQPPASTQATPPAQTPPAQTSAPAAAPQTAGGAPENPDQCLKAASDLAQSAEERKLAETQLDKIEDLLTKMETHCDARQFVEAMAVASDIKSLIETR